MAGLNSNTLEELILRIASEDAEAFANLYLITKPAVYAYALSILKNTYDAEDALQDCYLNIRAYAGQYRHGSNPMAWILTIVKNLSLQILQQHKRTADPIPESYIPSKSADPEDKIIVEGCLKVLSDESRQIVILHAVAGFKYREIAKFMSLPIHTVITKYRRALQKMRTEL